LAEAEGTGFESGFLPEGWPVLIKETPVAYFKAMTAGGDIRPVETGVEAVDTSDRRHCGSVGLIEPGGKEVGWYRRTLPRQAPWTYEFP